MPFIRSPMDGPSGGSRIAPADKAVLDDRNDENSVGVDTLLDVIFGDDDFLFAIGIVNASPRSQVDNIVTMATTNAMTLRYGRFTCVSIIMLVIYEVSWSLSL